MYNFRSRSYWLRRLENYGRKERVAVDEYTIEHILPKSEDNSDKIPLHWRQALGTDWKRIWDAYGILLGNLNTLPPTTPTTAMCAHSLISAICRTPPEKGLKHSPLKLNQGLGVLDTWNEETIKARAGKLAGIGVGVWPAPKLSQDVLDAYRLEAIRN